MKRKENMNFKISVVIPFYNSKKYLDQCIKSVANQTFREIQIILVDDGSFDESITICKKWQSIDARITILQQENNGVSSARNLGLLHACSKYCLFVDSDDLLSPNALSTMYDCAESSNADVIICGRKMLSTKREYGHNYPMDKIFKFEVGDRWTSEFFAGNIETFVTNKLFKTSFLRKNSIEFSDVSIYEDFIFMQDIFLANATMFYIPQQLYIYRFNRRGALSKYQSSMLKSTSLIYNKNLALSNGDDYVKKLIMECCAGFITNCILQESVSNKKNIIKNLTQIKGSEIFSDVANHIDTINTSKEKRLLIKKLALGKFDYLICYLKKHKVKRSFSLFLRRFICVR